MNTYIVACPHCELMIMVNKNELNCKIFRHGIYKNTYTQINPHYSKEICDKLIKDNLIIGCGKPFKLIINKKDINECKAIICDYI